jgi:hypothetical protein
MRMEEKEMPKRIQMTRPDRRRGKGKLMWTDDLESDL